MTSRSDIDTLGGAWAATHTWHSHLTRPTTIGCYGVVHGLSVCEDHSVWLLIFFPFPFLHNLSWRKGPWGGICFWVGRRLHIILYCCFDRLRDNHLGGTGDLVQSATIFFLIHLLSRVSPSLTILSHNMKRQMRCSSINPSPTLTSSLKSAPTIQQVVNSREFG